MTMTWQKSWTHLCRVTEMFNDNQNQEEEKGLKERIAKFVVLGVISVIVFKILGLESVQKVIQWLAGIWTL